LIRPRDRNSTDRGGTTPDGFNESESAANVLPNDKDSPKTIILVALIGFRKICRLKHNQLVNLNSIKTKYQVDLAEILIFFFTVLLFLPTTGLDGDRTCWIGWSMFFSSSPFTKVYSSGYINYPPFFLYFLKLFSFVFNSEGAIKANINWLKTVAFIFDLLPLVVMFRFFRNSTYLSWTKYLLLFNIGYLYNSLYWGQVDSIHNAFIAMACLYLYSRPLLAAALIVFAVNSKLQTISILPVFAIAFIPYVRSDKYNILRLAAAGIITQVIILSPFILFGGLRELAKMAVSSVGYYPVLSMNAFNFWYLVIPGDLVTISSKLPFMGISYQTWGMLLFFGAAIFVILPLFILSLTKTKDQLNNHNSIAFLALTAGLTILIFFYFNTEMHERYSHGAMILFFIYGAFTKRMDLFLLTSVVYLLSMDLVLKALNLDYTHFYFQPVFLSCFYLIIILLALSRLYNLSVVLGVKESLLQIRTFATKTFHNAQAQY
jgi:hypothetical protein